MLVRGRKNTSCTAVLTTQGGLGLDQGKSGAHFCGASRALIFALRNEPNEYQKCA